MRAVAVAVAATVVDVLWCVVVVERVRERIMGRTPCCDS